jgi:hypothetical protein
MSCRRTLAVAIVATAALGEIFASPSRLRSAFYAVDDDTGHPSRVTPGSSDAVARVLRERDRILESCRVRATDS